MAEKNPSPAKLRELVMQALYQKEISGSSNTDLIKQFKQTNRNFNLKGFENCLREIKKDILEINSIIEKHTNIDIEQISKIELAILKQAIYELKQNIYVLLTYIKLKWNSFLLQRTIIVVFFRLKK